MLYITGIHALNIEDSLETCGDWHTSALQLQDLHLKESTGSTFGNWGISWIKRYQSMRSIITLPIL